MTHARPTCQMPFGRASRSDHRHSYRVLQRGLDLITAAATHMRQTFVARWKCIGEYVAAVCLHPMIAMSDTGPPRRTRKTPGDTMRFSRDAVRGR
ncbi:hypothetical protein M3S04_06860 [Xanthomonas sp. PPL139]|uniref:hypothetical protein n=1 Tax=unclassified Xanthomonas TaxID=2643310 RepID=UPI0033B21273